MLLKAIPTSICSKVGDYSLKIHKSTYHLFSAFISKRGFSSLQTRKSLCEILSQESPLPKAWRKNCDAIQLRIIDNKLHILTQQKYSRLLITYNRLAFLLPIWSDYV